jgi:hypothetical protein
VSFLYSYNVSLFAFNRMWLCIFFFCTASILSAQVQDSISKVPQSNTSRPFMRNYIGVASSYSLNQRTVGIPTEYATRYGNAPLMSFGLNVVLIGDLLFQSNQIRTQATIERYLNVYPSSKLIENLRTSFEIGYNVIETPTLNVYPFVGFGVGLFHLDSLVRLFGYSAEGGIGADYFIPSTPFLLGLQAAYSHSFNFSAPIDTPNNQPGITLRAHVSIFLRNKYSAFGWD